jgi:hypothetical protein
MPRLRLVVTVDRALAIARLRAPAAAQLLSRLRQRVSDAALYAGIDLNGMDIGLKDRELVHRDLGLLAADRLIEWEPFRSASTFQLVRAPNERDWRELAQHRQRESTRLERIRGYTRCTGCRRVFLLRYFGEEPAQAACSGCDNCLHNRGARTHWLARRLFSYRGIPQYHGKSAN